MDGGQRQVGGRRQFTEGDLAAGIGNQFQKFENAFNGLHASGGFSAMAWVS